MMRRALIALALVATACSGTASSGNSVDLEQHIVQAGETWAQIAAEHNVSLPGMQRLNCDGNQTASLPSSCTGAPRVGRALHVPPVTLPPTTTSTTTTVPPPPTTTTLPATTTTVAPTTTVPPATTTTAPATTTSTLPPTTSSTSPTTSTTQPPEPPSGFLASFDTAADFYDRFQLDVHFRDDASVDWGRIFPGDHNMACGAPTTQRNVHLHPEVDGANVSLASSELFWWCAPAGAETGHVMTGMADVDGYTILSFAPDRSFANVTRVCWDVNSTDLGGRKWTQALVIPEAAYQANGGRLDYISPVTQDVDQTALPLPAGSFAFQNWDHKLRLYRGPNEVLFDWAQFSTTDKAKRYRHCMTDNGNGTVTVEQQREIGAMGTDTDGWRRVTVPGSFPAQARVIFQDDNYTPEKDGPIAGFTWHWDNIDIRVDVG